MKEFAPLIGSFWYLLRGAGMTVLMAASAVAPATLLGILLALLQVFGGRPLRSAILGYLFLICILLCADLRLLPVAVDWIDLPPFWGVVLVIAFITAPLERSVPRRHPGHCRRRRTRRAAWYDAPLDAADRRMPPGRGYRTPCQPLRQLVKATSLVSIVGLWELRWPVARLSSTLARFRSLSERGRSIFASAMPCALWPAPE
jgi:hypothetical protein